MNHPTREQWLSYLYDELDPNARCEAEAHLQSCAECRRQLEQWQRVRHQLSAWKVPLPAPAASPAPAPNRRGWAAAAALLLAAGAGAFVLGQASALPARAEAQLQQTVRNEIQRQLESTASFSASHLLESTTETRRQLAEFVSLVREARDQDRQLILARLLEIERQRAADYASLRRDLETVAVQAETWLDQTHQQLGKLASHQRHEPQP